MKILIVNSTENQGGAAISAKRLYESLLIYGVKATFLVNTKQSSDFRIISTETKKDKLFQVLSQQLDQFPLRKYNSSRVGTIFSPNNTFFTKSTLKRINSINPDIIHLHWVNHGMINIKDLIKLKKPIVWTMHDSWLFTGGCHLPNKCQKYIKECYECEVLGSNVYKDLSNKIFRIKQYIFDQLDMNIVSPSNWLGLNAKRSILLKKQSISIIPNPIDTKLYCPTEKNIARKLLGLSSHKKIILFAASSATSDLNKGFHNLHAAINKLKLDNILLVVMGGHKPQKNQNFNFPIKYLGEFSDDVSIKLIYNSADVTVVPSLSENLSNTIMESLACGIPTVAYNIGGNSDMIDHKNNGYLSIPYDPSDLAKGIEWILNNDNYSQLSSNARLKVVNNFDHMITSKKYIDLYKEILN
jgi:glycosyltransferase involved in cell wall biosynthesis